MAILTTTNEGLNFIGGTTFIQTGTTTLMAIATNGDIQFSQYGAGTLVTDASGNITVSSGGGAGGPYLPLSAGSSYPLTGDLYLDDDSGATPSLYFKNGANNFWRYLMESGGDFSIKEGTSTRLTFQAGGNVGIGETSPAVPLHISRDSASGENIALLLDNNDTTAGSEIGMLFRCMTGGGNTDFEIFGKANAVNDMDLVFESDGSNERVRFTGNGNVGIGATSPAGKLTIADTAFTTAYNSIKGLFFDNSNISSGDGNFGAGIEFGKLSNGGNLYKKAAIIPVQSGGDSDQMGISFFVSNTTSQASPVIEAMRVDYGGNVGIGTASPDTIMEILGANPILTIRDSDTSTSTATSTIRFAESNANDTLGNYWDVGYSPVNLLNFDFNSSTKMTITSAGNVGIGNTNPNYLLDIGAANIENPVDYIRLNPTNGNGGGTSNTLGGGLIWAPNYNTYTKKSAGIIAVGEGNYFRTGLAFFTNNSASATDDYSERMRIDMDGNVGIGDTGPNVKLQVSTTSPSNNVAALIGDGWVGNSSYHKEGGLLLISGTSQDTTQTGAGIAFQTRNTANTNYWKSSMIMDRDGAIRFTLGGAGTVAGSEDFTILSGGNVGIGTTSPGYKLTVNGDVDVNNGAILAAQAYGINLGVSGYDIVMPTTTRIAIKTSSSERVSILNNGDVGIGTTAPLNKLHVAGSVRATSGVYFNSTSTAYFKIENDSSNNELDIYGGSLVPGITIDNSGLLKFGGYGLAGSGTPTKLLGLDSNSNVVTATSFNLILDDTPAANTTSGSGNIVNWSVSEIVTAGTLYAVKTNGGWTTADADSEARSTYMLAIALGSNATAGMLLQGFFYKSSHGFTIGAPLYVSNTAGAFSNSRPTGTGDYVRIIGYATSANYIYFDPDKTWVKIA